MFGGREAQPRSRKILGFWPKFRRNWNLFHSVRFWPLLEENRAKIAPNGCRSGCLGGLGRIENKEVTDSFRAPAGSTPAASTINKSFTMNDLSDPAKILG